jgi:hypothetical protein
MRIIDANMVHARPHPDVMECLVNHGMTVWPTSCERGTSERVLQFICPGWPSSVRIGEGGGKLVLSVGMENKKWSKEEIEKKGK